MGLGDQLMATGMARGAQARGVRIAFGDGQRIIWDANSPAIFANNPNIAPRGSEGASDLEWIAFYKGNRLYNTHGKGKWIWNYDFRAIPGAVYLTQDEQKYARRHGVGHIIVEPNVPWWKSVAANKDWGKGKYQRLVLALRHERRVIQFQPETRSSREAPLPGALGIATRTFREALAIMANADLYVGPEGGLHHAAAAFGVPAVVLFGGFIPPEVTGYAGHVNLTGNSTEACGSLKACDHCRAAMASISVDEVIAAAKATLRKR